MSRKQFHRRAIVFLSVLLLVSLTSFFRRRVFVAHPDVYDKTHLIDSATNYVRTPKQQKRRLDEDFCSESIPTIESPLQFTFYLLSLVYMFLASEHLCDDYFLPALEEMSDASHFNLTPDVAGATLMAMGGSASELFTNLFATLKKSDVGVGTIVGSAVFNVLVVIAACCLLSTSPSSNPLTLTPWPVLRDFSFYSVGLIALAIAMASGTITFGESIMLFSLYLLYVLVMYFNQRLYAYYQSYHGGVDANDENIPNMNVEEEVDLELVTTSEETAPKKSSTATYERNSMSYAQVVQSEPDSNEDREGNEINEDDDEDSTPRGFISYIKWIVLYPLQLSLRYTIPTKTSKFYLFKVLSSCIPHHICYIQFCVSIVWIGIFSDYTVFCTEVIGKYLGVPPVVMGLTLVAAGSSVQDLISSVIVARQGEGDMAISSSIGSNIFDILVCLPLPWMLYLFLHRNQADAVMVRCLLWLCPDMNVM